MNIVPASDYLTIQERKMLMEKNDMISAIYITTHWMLIGIAFGLTYYFPNPFVIFISLWVLGGQQLSCAILMHDASHRSVFSNQKLNDLVGNWLGAYPIFNNMNRYRAYHLQHHLNVGLEDDPDLLLTRGYPTTKQSMYRKFFRDLSGQTGVKALVGLFMMHLGFLDYNLGNKVVRISQKNRTWSDFFKMFYHNALPPVLFQILFFSMLVWLASPWLYLLWIGAYLTTFQFCLRVRSMAEHSMVEDSQDPYKNTRTVRANLIERLLFAPYHVNYHAEHHMLMNIPAYNLPKAYKILSERGYYEKGTFAPNYTAVLKMAMAQ